MFFYPLQCPLSCSLPAFYLLDSICKNLGPPYTTLFARQLPLVFLTTYRNVDLATQVKLEELVATWRTGGPNNTELFPTRVQSEIETALFGRGGRGGGISTTGRVLDQNRHFMTGVSGCGLSYMETIILTDPAILQQPSLASDAERSEVLQDVRRLLALRQSRSSHDLEDQSNHDQIQVLKQVRTILSLVSNRRTRS
jgi:pre-mRNA cleavage complex 2 protein Pcf11